jgi:formate dehydrogenase subunit gamma
VESGASALQSDPVAAEESPEEFQRLTVLMRVQHIILAVSCIILIVTGMPLRYPDSTFAELLFRTTDGVAGAGMLHRIAAAALTFVGVFHMGYVALTREGREQWKYLLPRVKDVVDVLLNVAYFLGIRRGRPQFDRFSYFEKFDYWAVYWGCVVMIGSGVILWFHEHVMRFLPKVAIDVAHEAHSDEGLLAMLAIIIWHFYNVHFNPDRFPMSWVWWTGKMTKEEMIEHHPLEYERISGQIHGAEPRDGGAEG